MNKEKERFQEFTKFIWESDEFGNNAINYLGTDTVPRLEDVFDMFLKNEQLSDGSQSPRSFSYSEVAFQTDLLAKIKEHIGHCPITWEGDKVKIHRTATIHDVINWLQKLIELSKQTL